MKTDVNVTVNEEEESHFEEIDLIIASEIVLSETFINSSVK